MSPRLPRLKNSTFFFFVLFKTRILARPARETHSQFIVSLLTMPSFTLRFHPSLDETTNEKIRLLCSHGKSWTKLGSKLNRSLLTTNDNDQRQRFILYKVKMWLMSRISRTLYWRNSIAWKEEWISLIHSWWKKIELKGGDWTNNKMNNFK